MLQVPTQGIAQWVERWSFVSLRGGGGGGIWSRGGILHAF